MSTTADALPPPITDSDDAAPDEALFRRLRVSPTAREWERICTVLVSRYAWLTDRAVAHYMGRGKHTPTRTELAAHLDASEEAVTTALATDDTFAPVSLDTLISNDPEQGTLLDNQDAIAAAVGVSQVQVSRVLRQTLARLRDELTSDE